MLADTASTLASVLASETSVKLKMDVIRACVAPKLVHFQRCGEGELVQRVVGAYTELQNAALFHCTGIDTRGADADRARATAGLAVSSGGLGWRQMDSYTKIARAASIISTSSILAIPKEADPAQAREGAGDEDDDEDEEKRPEAVHQLGGSKARAPKPTTQLALPPPKGRRTAAAWDAITLRITEDATAKLDELQRDLPGLHELLAPPKQKGRKRKATVPSQALISSILNKATASELAQRFIDEDDLPGLVHWKHMCAKGSGSAQLLFTGSARNADDEVTHAAAHHRLNLLDTSALFGQTCSGCRASPPARPSALRCKTVSNQTLRHNAVCDALARQLNQLIGHTTCIIRELVVDKGDGVVKKGRPGGMKLMDTVLRINTSKFWIDVTIVDPVSAMALKDEKLDLDAPLVNHEFKRRVEDKRARYSDLARKAGSTLKTMIVTTDGRIAGEGIDVLAELDKAVPDPDGLFPRPSAVIVDAIAQATLRSVWRSYAAHAD